MQEDCADGDGKSLDIFEHQQLLTCIRLFVIEGLTTIVWAFVASFILLDFPATSSRLTERERAIAVARLREGGVKSRGVGDERVGKVKSLKLAVCDWRTIGFVLGYMVDS